VSTARFSPSPVAPATAPTRLAQALEQEGRIRAALLLYKKVWLESFGRTALRDAASTATRRLVPSATLPSTPLWEEYYSK
jgi:hypothetical protein